MEFLFITYMCIIIYYIHTYNTYIHAIMCIIIYCIYTFNTTNLAINNPSSIFELHIIHTYFIFTHYFKS